jgi:hypothetical protein
MGLLDLKTDLKSLKFGTPPASDRPGGGNSGQPYITDPISSDIIPQSEDFLLRGGLNAPLDAANDVVRLTKMFGDFKSPNGILFIAKQNLLSRIAVNTQASGKGVNEGVYTPLTTLAQAGVGFVGGHLSKQGLNPLSGVKTYGPKSLFNPQGSTVIGDVIGGPDGKGNRLVDLIKDKQAGISKFPSTNILSYPGGPGSKLGIGRTNIKFATGNTGSPLRTGVNSGLPFKTYQVGLKNSKTDRENQQSFQSIIGNPFYSPLKGNGITTIFKKEFNPESIDIGLNDGNDGKFGRTFETSVYNKFNINSPEYLDGLAFPLQSTTRIYDNGTLTWDQNYIQSQVSPNNSKNVADPTLQDFRAPLLEDKKSSTIMSFAPDYTKALKRIEGESNSRINQESPGQKGNIINYSKGKIIDGTRVSVVDHINFQPLYKSSKVREGDGVAKNDLVKFRIGAVLRDGKKVFMHFRAFIDQFSDSYGAKWSGIQYMGRGEEFYKYGGFSRKISLSYTVAAQSKPEIMAQYKKLNFLASTLAPDYGGKDGSGYMGGVLTTLTLGGWCYELPGFIDSLTLDIPQESPWEIGIDDKGEFDPTVKEMPHICKVTMNFTPIHTFRPELQDNDYLGDKSEVSKYGNQHYIGLTNGYSDNYDPISLADAQKPK